MKNFKTQEDAKAFSIALNKILKEHNLESKQSMILEALAKVEGVDNWNILSAMYKKLTENEVHSIPINQINFPDTEYFHIDNGGFFFSFAQNVLMIKTNFFGYSDNIHYFRIGMEGLHEIVNILNTHKNGGFNRKKSINDSELEYEDGLLYFKNDYNKVLLSLHPAPIDEMIAYFEKLILEHNVKKESFNQAQSISTQYVDFDSILKTANKESIAKLPLLDKPSFIKIINNSDKEINNLPFISLEQLEQYLKSIGKTYTLNQVLNNMAIRYRHDFGLLDKPEQDKVKSYIRQIYHTFDLNLDEEKVKQILQVDKITWEQLKEEYAYQIKANHYKNKF